MTTVGVTTNFGATLPTVTSSEAQQLETHEEINQDFPVEKQTGILL
jgi:hypothetical protein